ncbi:uncharacterized protein LOC106659449 [Trichogramma pretiosum]|uniref:uncharacterized protein LOC106659449 n=1 Tax=Trichogramma pretiosum TaxID=7493 RepID=UPI0006C9894A|nr:uncharacterized protein LOC106659449 [Trichogramma pretiosum]
MSEREQRVLQELVKSRDAIRRKALMLKRGRDETERTVAETFKSIIKPLNKLVTLKEEKSPPVNQKNKFVQQTESDQVTEDEEDTAASITNGENEIIRDYLNLIENRSEDLDKLYGVRMKNNEYVLGKSPIEIAGSKLNIENVKYDTSAGLLELLFKRSPNADLITSTDKSTYRKILEPTNAHRRGFVNTGEICKYRSNKFSEIIEPLFKSGSGLLPSYKVAKRGRGLLPSHKVAKSHDSSKDFVYWNDPNELVDRLRLLVAERSAGNNAHDNEITSIIEELREAGYIH